MNDKTIDQQITQGIETESRDPNAKTRPARVRMKGTLNLDYPEDRLDREKFGYRWFADDPAKPGRIEQAKAAYWEHHEENSTPVTRPSGAQTMYLMRLPMEYWLEDKQLKREAVQRTMATETQLGVNEYAPDAQGRPEGGTSARVSQTTSDNPYS